jgi:NAD(P)-dependent dehydrogenase (short-subunit alcohol dehydrogenase family)
MSMKGITVVVTGASMGLGARIAEELVRQEASVLLCARSLAPLNETVTRLKALVTSGQIVAATVCDVTDERQVDELLAEALRLFPRVDGLVNNAGVYGPFGAIEEIEWEAWKRAIATNLFGMVYTSRVFVPHFKAHRRGKIVNISGGGATSPLPRISSYAASKAGMVRFAETLACELKDFGVDVNSIAPGVLNTRMTHQLLDEGAEAVGETFYDRISTMAEDGETSIRKASELVAYLCSPASNGITGRLISALWDPWATLHERKADLDGSDIYTIRRITPKDRGKGWED